MIKLSTNLNSLKFILSKENFIKFKPKFVKFKIKFIISNEEFENKSFLILKIPKFENKKFEIKLIFNSIFLIKNSFFSLFLNIFLI